jgi:hypothetical protein
MFGYDLAMPKPEFTYGNLGGLRGAYKRLPVYFDDIGKKRLQDHGYEAIKEPVPLGLDEYPPFIISMNADFGSFPVEITRRAMMFYTDTALPAYNERLRAKQDSILAEIQQAMTTHLYRRYAAEIASASEDDPLPKDWLQLSTSVLSSIIEHYEPVPRWSGVEYWDDYASDKRFNRVRATLNARLSTGAMSENGSNADDHWFFEGTDRIVVISPKDLWNRRDSFWAEVPTTLIDEDASYGPRIVMDKEETERFLGHKVGGNQKSQHKKRGLREKMTEIIRVARG